MFRKFSPPRATALALALAAGAGWTLTGGLTAGPAAAHGDMTPQAVDTTGLPEVGEEWLAENPYRNADEAVRLRAIDIGAKGYNSNCARCHGLEGISGGLAPDLRYLEASDWGDEWFLERFRHGYTQNGVTKMPSFEGLVSQEAAWAIRTYIETRPDPDQVDAVVDSRRELRDELAAQKDNPDALPEIAEKLKALSTDIEALSGGEVVDTPMSHAAALLSREPADAEHALMVLSDGLD